MTLLFWLLTDVDVEYHPVLNCLFQIKGVGMRSLIENSATYVGNFCFSFKLTFKSGNLGHLYSILCFDVRLKQDRYRTNFSNGLNEEHLKSSFYSMFVLLVFV